MSDAQIRVGPYASTGATMVFLDEPDNAGSLGLPVNCALDDTNDIWRWKYYFEKYDSVNDAITRSYEIFLPNQNLLVSVSDGGCNAYIEFEWFYQARNNFDFDLNYDLVAQVTEGGGTDATHVKLQVWVDDVQVVELEDGDPGGIGTPDSASLDGYVSFACPNTSGSLPKKVKIRAEGGLAEAGSIDSEVSLALSYRRPI